MPDLATDRRGLRLFIVAGEHSGDALGAKLIAALRRLYRGPLHLAGVGGEDMTAEGLATLYPLGDVAVMGPVAILRRLPGIVSRVYRTVDACIAFRPDVLVIIDAPEFTHPIARRVRQRMPDVPIIDYVSPSVWAWRPGRAKRMRAYVDHVLALLPFEPEAHRRLGGPACTYVGHPIVERLEAWRAIDTRPLMTRLGLDPGKPLVVVLPGSRLSEVQRLLDPFAGTIEKLVASGLALEVVVPAVPHLKALIEERVRQWPVRALIVEGEADKIAAFRAARAALAASGTVTLELAAVGTPMVVAYKVDRLAVLLRPLLKVHSVVLANLVLGENAFPELLQEACVPDELAPALAEILAEGPARDRQLAALARIPGRLAVAHESPSARAAEIVLALATGRPAAA